MSEVIKYLRELLSLHDLCYVVKDDISMASLDIKDCMAALQGTLRGRNSEIAVMPMADSVYISGTYGSDRVALRARRAKGVLGVICGTIGASSLELKVTNGSSVNLNGSYKGSSVRLNYNPKTRMFTGFVGEHCVRVELQQPKTH